MDSLPSSLVTAVACSAAAGKNPWLPLALLLLIAAPDSVPALAMNPELHRQLHGLMPVEALWTLGAIFGVLAIADSLADKVGFIEKWLVPVSTAWRPFAGIACATLVGVAAAQDAAAAEAAAEGVAALRGALTEPARASLIVGGSIVALTVGLAAVASWIATVSKTGIRLLLTMVPVPGLKLAHSLIDDFFALGAVFAGFVFADTLVVTLMLLAYVGVGLITAPILTRLAIIHGRVAWGLLAKARRSADAGSAGAPPRPPGWLRRWMAEGGLADASVLPAYVYRAPEVGWCRGGYLVIAEGTTAFVARVWWRPKALLVDAPRFARMGLAESTTARVVTLVERLPSGGLREVGFNLYPAVEDEVLPVLAWGATQAGLARVRSDSASARAGLPGHADRERSVRFLPAEAAGSLWLQGLVTIAAAVVVGVLSAGVFIPIGAGYLLSPFERRFVIGMCASAYLTLAVLGSMGLGWPAAVLYATALNAVALRDLTRNALKARVDGFVDRRAWVPDVAGHVWVPLGALADASDRAVDGQADPLTDGSWRAVVRLLAREGGSSPERPSRAVS